MPENTWIAFIGGDRSVHNRLFYDPGSHEACARYAAKVCPYLSSSLRINSENADEINLGLPSGYKVAEQNFVTRPDKMAIYCVRTFKVKIVKFGEQPVALIEVPKKPRKIDWDIMPESTKWLSLGTKLPK